jgi:hypothetical protein
VSFEDNKVIWGRSEVIWGQSEVIWGQAHALIASASSHEPLPPIVPIYLYWIFIFALNFERIKIRSKTRFILFIKVGKLH